MKEADGDFQVFVLKEKIVVRQPPALVLRDLF